MRQRGRERERDLRKDASKVVCRPVTHGANKFTRAYMVQRTHAFTDRKTTQTNVDTNLASA